MAIGIKTSATSSGVTDREFKLILSTVDTLSKKVDRTYEALSSATSGLIDKEIPQLKASVQEISSISRRLLDPNQKIDKNEVNRLESLYKNVDRLIAQNSDRVIGSQSVSDILLKYEASTKRNTVQSKRLVETLSETSRKLGQSFSTYLADNLVEIDTAAISKSAADTASAALLGPIGPILNRFVRTDKIVSDSFSKSKSIVSRLFGKTTDSTIESDVESEKTEKVSTSVNDFSERYFKMKEGELKDQTQYQDDLKDAILNNNNASGKGLLGFKGMLGGSAIGTTLGTAISKISSVVTKMATFAMRFLGPVAAVVATGVTAFKLGTAIYENLPLSIRDKISDVVGGTVESIQIGFKEALSSIQSWGSSFVSSLGSMYTNLISTLTDVFTKFGTYFKSAYTTLSEIYSSTIGYVGSTLNRGYNLASNTVGGVGKSVAKGITKASESGYATDAVFSMYDDAKTATTNAMESVFGPEEIKDLKVSGASAKTPYDKKFEEADKKYGLKPGTLKAMAYTESNFNPKAKSHAGAEGLMQFMPGTAKRFGIDSSNPEQSIDAAGKYMQILNKRYEGLPNQEELAIRAYNAGEGNIDSYIGRKNTRRHGRYNPTKENNEYAPKVFAARAVANQSTQFVSQESVAKPIIKKDTTPKMMETSATNKSVASNTASQKMSIDTIPFINDDLGLIMASGVL